MALAPTNADSQLAPFAKSEGGAAEPPTVVPFRLHDLGAGEQGTVGIDLAADAPLSLRIELGRAQLDAPSAQALRVGSVVALDRGSQDVVDVVVGGTLVARGQLVVVEGKLCVRIVTGSAAQQAA